MNESRIRSILCDLLDCGTDDLDMLEDVKYSYRVIVLNLRDNGEYVTLNNIMYEVFQMGIGELGNALEDKLAEYLTAFDDTEDEKELGRLRHEFSELSSFDTVRDASYHINFSDTHFYLRHLDNYKLYLGQEISAIEERMGIKFTDGGDDDE